jgi:hypothetical protein
MSRTASQARRRSVRRIDRQDLAAGDGGEADVLAGELSVRRFVGAELEELLETKLRPCARVSS